MLSQSQQPYTALETLFLYFLTQFHLTAVWYIPLQPALAAAAFSRWALACNVCTFVFPPAAIYTLDLYFKQRSLYFPPCHVFTVLYCATPSMFVFTGIPLSPLLTMTRLQER